MSYYFMSNIKNFDEINSPDKAYLSISTGEEIIFKNSNNMEKKSSFLMIRAHSSNNLLVEILPYGYGVYIPADEMWSVDSITDIEGFKVRKAFEKNNNSTTTSITTSAKLQWMIGYR